MRAYDPSALANSPRSSDGAATGNGSPDTKLTAFSPEDVRPKARVDSAICIPQDSDGVSSFSPGPGADPFVVPASQPRLAHLCPTALSFRPVGVTGTLTDTGLKRPIPSVGYGMSYLAAGSEPDSRAVGNSDSVYSAKTFSGFGPIGKSALNKDGSHPFEVNFEQLDYEHRSRAFVIEEVPRNLSHLTLAGFFSRREFGTIKGPLLSELSSKGKIYVAFTDSREAKNAIEKVQVLHPDWRITPLTAREYAQQSTTSDVDRVSDFEGQICVSVYYDSRDPSIDQRAIISCVRGLTESFGDVKTFKALPVEQNNVSEFEVEFFDTRDAENAVATLNGATVEDCILEIKLHKPDVEDPSSDFFHERCSSKDVSPRRDSRRVVTSGSSGRDSPHLELSPTGRSTIPRGERAGLMDWMLSSTSRPVLPPHQEYNRFTDTRFKSQNFVDVERIRRGLDVRTTIMLRNIPNKIDQSMLKEIVDETSFGKYDFMYLRIVRFSVGYAFINFEDPIDIIDVSLRNYASKNGALNELSLSKPELAALAIQGKDCLVQKFRNSSVMLEDPSFRPKIFHTGTGPLAGTEDRFPGPDNLSKMRRSVENAEHVGLFAPRVNRDEQRRRRSSLGRGRIPPDRLLCVRESSYRRPSVLGAGSAPDFRPPWYDTQRSPRGPRTS
ncbi:Meiosis protein MEI2 [Rasamsonia emersonii CBS 393.64]|uniref:Meiosis protein MEI2 n=1 Tax=Rasamsonia emersonii (strain ATCC 16479 / CBS 393.64 / IMI 116815) TaxID=1408163 RepID=A0A0F4YI54_RASE3|nr:Meiosis protein MEI2 [Rasamsonia emersonii CBS 393.64]KKA17546.1 Meiosis protein MEI2 [Rasamsonia emersonii CBS 393.64]